MTQPPAETIFVYFDAKDTNTPPTDCPCFRMDLEEQGFTRIEVQAAEGKGGVTVQRFIKEVGHYMYDTGLEPKPHRKVCGIQGAQGRELNKPLIRHAAYFCHSSCPENGYNFWSREMSYPELWLCCCELEEYAQVEAERKQ